jgi:hypothetical protein
MHAWLTVTTSGGTSAAIRLRYLDYTPHSMVTLSGSIHGQAIMATMPAP